MLTDIKTTECPYCKRSEIKRQVQEEKHINEHWNESLEFKCGYKLKYTPNYHPSPAIEVSECQWSSAWKAKIKKREQSIEKVKGFINNLKVDDEFKQSLLGKFDYYIHLRY